MEPCRTAVLLALASGLRVGELLGLKWEDVNFEALEVNVTRSVVKQKITRCKTEASRKPIPLDPALAEVLLNWRLQAPYPRGSDWVFASPHRKGRQPYWPGVLFRVHFTARAAGGEDSRQRRLAHPAAHLRHFDEGERRRHQNHTGAVAACELQSDGGHQTRLVKMILPVQKAAVRSGAEARLLLIDSFQTLGDCGVLPALSINSRLAFRVPVPVG